MIAADLTVLRDFGEAVTLRKADGSAPVSTKGLYDETTEEIETERGTLRSRQPTITIPQEGTDGYAEDDEIDLGGTTYIILDRNGDELTAVLTVSKK